MREQPDTMRDAGKFERPPHQQSDPDPLPEREQRRVEQEERDAVRKPDAMPGRN